MADKNFGVKGINFISDPGTPTISIASSTISYAGSLNLNADTVAISTNVSIGGSVVSNIIVSNSYSVGIGTTILTEKLNISGNANISGVVSATSFVGSGASLTGLVSNQLVSIDDAQPHYILLTKSQSGTSSTVSSSYNYIYYNPNSKYLGIGTDTPTANLDVNGTGRFVGAVTAPTFQGTATTATTAIGLGTTSSINTSGIITATGGFNIGIQSGGINITTGVITAINFVGSGNTFSYNSTTKVIDITISSSSVSGGSSVSISSNTTNQNQYIPYATSFGNTTGFGATTLLVYNPSTGNLGIGTTNPTSKLQVQGDVSISGVTTSGGIVVTTGNVYKVGVDTVLNSTTLGSGVTYSSLTTVGTLNQLKVSSTGITTVGFLTASNIWVSGVTTSGGIVVTTGNVYKVGVDTVLNSTTLGSGVTHSSLTSVGTLNQLRVSSTGITTLGVVTTGNIYSTGVITATTFSTGIATENVGFTTSTISGPSLMFISPYSIGINTGTVRILGNLIVEGSTTTQTQATIQSSASIIGIAISETSNAALEGAGIGIGSTNIQKTFTYRFAGGGSLKSSENLNVYSGKSYQIDDVSVLSSTDLGSTVVNAPGITTVGTLKQLVVSSNTSTDAVRITQVGSGNALIVEDSANPDATAFIVSSDGSVGIGTTVPAYKLTITNNALPTLGLTHAIADFTGSVDGYTQLNVRNSLAGASASADLIATADTGSDTTNFIDLGINNSAFSSGSWTVNGALDGYLYTSDGSLSIGIATNNTAKYISFFAGGLLAANEQVRINQTGVGIGTISPTSKLHVAGDVLISGISTLGITSTTNLTSQQLNVSGISTLGITSTTNLTSQQLNVSGISTLGITSTTNLTSQQLNVSGISTLGITSTTNLTSQQLNVSGITTTQTLNVGTGGTVITTTAGGYVGIGTTNPGEKLQVDGNIRVGISTTSNYIAFRGTYNDDQTSYTHTFIGERLYEPTGGSANNERSELLLFKGNDPTSTSIGPGPDRIRLAAGEIRFDTITVGLSTAGTFEQIGVSTVLVNRMILTSDGNLGIGTTNPTQKLHVQGNAYITGVTTSTDFDSLSDFNLKTNIHQIEDSLAKVIQIRGVTFNWKETNRSSAGVIAQEVEKVLPELVNGEETKTVNYNGVIGALVEAVKELKVENDVLRERLDEVYKKVFG
jgi:hypothetical protein